ncbi:MAG TPA: TIGR02391 family protein [Burkholderiales bacterium]|nr:TIGR02391 family protein [Burkholderiales bacterium]
MEETAISNLATAIEILEEKIGDVGASPTGRARKAFTDFDLHPEIAEAAAQLFMDGHYANAVEDACKVLDGLVKVRSNKFESSGTELVQTVFSPKNPVLAFNNLATPTDQSEQQGMMFLYSGACSHFEIRGRTKSSRMIRKRQSSTSHF